MLPFSFSEKPFFSDMCVLGPITLRHLKIVIHFKNFIQASALNRIYKERDISLIIQLHCFVQSTWLCVSYSSESLTRDYTKGYFFFCMLLDNLHLWYKSKFQGKRHFILKISYMLKCIKKIQPLNIWKGIVNKPQAQTKNPKGICMCWAGGIKNAMSYRVFFKAKCFHTTLENHILVYVCVHTDIHTEIKAACPHVLWYSSFWYHNWGHVIEENHTSEVT